MHIKQLSLPHWQRILNTFSFVPILSFIIFILVIFLLINTAKLILRLLRRHLKILD